MKALSLLSGIAILTAGLALASRAADDAQPGQPVDQMLEQAVNSPQMFMFQEHAQSKAESKSYDLIVTSARGVNGEPEHVFVRPGTIRVFRADAGLDEFTRNGGWYWRCGDTHGKLQFKQPGAVVMVIRDMDGTVNWYSLAYDFRC